MTKRRRVTYSVDAFRDAVTAYRNKTMSSVAASKEFGVPESTIRKHKDNKTNRVGSGRPCTLSMDQEQYFVALLQELQSIGVRLTRDILSKITGDFMRMVKKHNKDISKYIYCAYDKAIFAYIYRKPRSTLVSKFFQTKFK